MTSISSAYSLDVSRVMRLPMSQAVKLPDSETAALRDVTEKAYQRPVGPADNAPENIYAQVKVNGEVVATLYNSGAAETSNSVGAKLQDIFANTTGSGPQAAQTRAEQIAAALGGTIEKASTAQTPEQWAARPPHAFYIDYAAMAADEKKNQSEAASATTTSQINAQLLAHFQEVIATV